MRLLLVGHGRMGRAIETMALEQGEEIVGIIGRDDPGLSRFAGVAEVAIEVTTPASAERNVRACLEAGIPVVCGTTGWQQGHPAVIEEARARAGALLLAANFSMGVALLIELAARAGALFAPHPHFAGAIVETHHAAKRDAPSGTAIAIEQATARTLGRDVPVTSVRVGSVPGTHTLLFDGPFEQISLTHEARDRRVFADGALRAARWLRGRQGVFTMRDVLGIGR